MTTTRRSLIAPLLAMLVVGGCAVTGGATSSPSLGSPSPVATASPPSTSPTPGGSIARACDAASLAARITGWEGAAGHRIATVELKNTGSELCTIPALLQPQLVDGKGAVLIDGKAPQASQTVTVSSGAALKALVQDGNYCGAAPAAPVTVAFVLPSGAGRILAAPLSPTDTSGVPPCSGSPGSPGDIEMRPWKA